MGTHLRVLSERVFCLLVPWKKVASALGGLIFLPDKIHIRPHVWYEGGVCQVVYVCEGSNNI